MDHKKVSLFYIKEKRSNVNFELELSNWIRFHFIFYIEKLEPADPKTLIRIKESPRLSQYNEYEVEKIEDYDPETCQYIIKWRGYSKKENT